MEHFITEIRIDKLRHLSDLTITLNPEHRQHLMVTGKNGSGKTSLLLEMRKYLRAINDGKLNTLSDKYVPWLLKAEENMENSKSEEDKYSAEKEYHEWLGRIQKYQDGVELSFHGVRELDTLYAKGDFVTAYFPANRRTQIERAQGVEQVELSQAYPVDSDPAKLLHKYMVHLKTQQSYARNEGDLEVADRIQRWFDRFVGALRILLDSSELALKYDYRQYDFKIHEPGRTPFTLEELSDGYSSVIYIVSDLILRMDRNWILGDRLSEYDLEGIVLIDELETHLHIELQKKIMPFLTEFFPRLQFIITTHSPYILNSISNAKAYDLERGIELENLALYSADGLSEAYFEADEYSEELKGKFERYQLLKKKEKLTEDERAERARLRLELKNIPRGLSPEAYERFEAIEGRGL